MPAAVVRPTIATIAMAAMVASVTARAAIVPAVIIPASMVARAVLPTMIAIPIVSVAMIPAVIPAAIVVIAAPGPVVRLTIAPGPGIVISAPVRRVVTPIAIIAMARPVAVAMTISCVDTDDEVVEADPETDPIAIVRCRR
jgi:hypothetical protein